MLFSLPARTRHSSSTASMCHALRVRCMSSAGGVEGGGGGGGGGGDFNKSPIGWGSVMALVFLGSGAVGVYQYQRAKRLKAMEIKSAGRPAIGGPFSLVDHRGKPVTDLDFRGRYMLVYFGFTYCPDICPAELQKMGRVMGDLKAKNLDEFVDPIMITVDPRRDTVKALADYVKDYHPRLIGLTGTPQQIMDVSKSYRVYASSGLTDAEMDASNDYLVDHTIFFYLMGPDGKIREYFGKNLSSEQVSAGIEKSMLEELGASDKSWWANLWGK